VAIKNPFSPGKRVFGESTEMLRIWKGNQGGERTALKKTWSGVTLRSLILGTILTVINCYWVISTEIVRTVVIGTVLTVFFNAIFTVFILAVINLLFLKYLPSAVLT
jgi:hypothetical protein